MRQKERRPSSSMGKDPDRPDLPCPSATNPSIPITPSKPLSSFVTPPPSSIRRGEYGHLADFSDLRSCKLHINILRVELLLVLGDGLTGTPLTTSARISALNIVGELLRKVGVRD